MDYSITDLMKAASMMSKKYFGRQDEYTISSPSRKKTMVAGMWTTLTGLSIITT